MKTNLAVGLTQVKLLTPLSVLIAYVTIADYKHPLCSVLKGDQMLVLCCNLFAATKWPRTLNAGVIY